MKLPAPCKQGAAGSRELHAPCSLSREEKKIKKKKKEKRNEKKYIYMNLSSCLTLNMNKFFLLSYFKNKFLMKSD
jgi:hypothetical protein